MLAALEPRVMAAEVGQEPTTSGADGGEAERPSAEERADDGPKASTAPQGDAAAQAASQPAATHSKRRLPSVGNGTITSPAGQVYPIPLFYDDLVNENGGPDLPAYGMLSVDEQLLAKPEELDEEGFEKLRQSLKKKRRRLDKGFAMTGAKVSLAGRLAGSNKGPSADINSPEIQAFIAENMKNAEAEMIRRAYKRLVINNVSKHHRIVNMYFKKQQSVLEKLAENAARETKQRFFKVHRESKRSEQRMRRLVREMMFYWKKQGKGNARERQRADREAAEARRKEEEAREEKRKQQQLNFLLTQTELYAHFMAKKMGHEQPDPVAEQQQKLAALKDEDKAQEEEMQKKATEIANMYVSQTELATQTFDHESERLRLEANGSMQNPSTMPTLSDVLQPTGFKGQLKGYQLKGLQWLANIYEQGLNGILADEMGLGKTVQAIALLAYLAEEKNIRGPFLVVAPGSTLHNWDREIQAFFPQFKVLPYWGNKVQRKDIRPCIHPKKLYGENAHNVVVTSYDIILKDEAQLRRIKWQFMILDEAQAIKNADSFRWKTLLSFSCRNRLLLTGTPIQNNMAELWALLHFIMPTLFDSHEEFNEWFSKGIEGHAVGTQSLNEHQLRRLHTVLQPFMLRRVKKDVENDMAPKVEVVVPCGLTSRQRELYRRIRNKVSIVDLFEGKQVKKMNEGKVSSLMNIVMQLRKVCNHPELFDQQQEITPYHFAVVNPPLEQAPWGELDWAWCSGRRSPISFALPRLVYDEGMACLPSRFAGHLQTLKFKLLAHALCVFEPSNVHAAVHGEGGAISGLSFLGLLGLAPSDVKFFASADYFQAWYFGRVSGKGLQRLAGYFEANPAAPGSASAATFTRSMLRLSQRLPKCLYTRGALAPALDWSEETLVKKGDGRLLGAARLIRAIGGHIERVRAVPCELVCSSSGFASQQKRLLRADWEHRALFGLKNHQSKFWPEDEPIGRELRSLPRTRPLLSATSKVLGSGGIRVKFYALAKALADGGKLKAFDKLLQDLKQEGHRVLVFCQMTQMMNILEDYMIFRKLRYLRLDGSTKLEDRRDVVDSFQQNDEIFAFLLSTRAGGLGINLTAADTVIFYESDWNPTMDQQAMDRAHRLGQTKKVTVYRLICKDTIEEKILKRATQKEKVSKIVYNNKSSKDEEANDLSKEDVVNLLL